MAHGAIVKCTCGGRLDVVDSYSSKTEVFLVRRRRECQACKKRFSTVEVVADEYEALVGARVNNGKKARDTLAAIIRLAQTGLKDG